MFFFSIFWYFGVWLCGGRVLQRPGKIKQTAVPFANVLQEKGSRPQDWTLCVLRNILLPKQSPQCFIQPHAIISHQSTHQGNGREREPSLVLDVSFLLSSRKRPLALVRIFNLGYFGYFWSWADSVYYDFKLILCILNPVRYDSVLRHMISSFRCRQDKIYMTFHETTKREKLKHNKFCSAACLKCSLQLCACVGQSLSTPELSLSYDFVCRS